MRFWFPYNATDLYFHFFTHHIPKLRIFMGNLEYANSKLQVLVSVSEKFKKKVAILNNFQVFCHVMFVNQWEDRL